MDDHGAGSTRPRRPEPSWPTVIATTVRLWVERHDAVRRWTVRTRRAFVVVIAAAIVAVGAAVVIRGWPAQAPSPAAVPSGGMAPGAQEAGSQASGSQEADSSAGGALLSAATVRDRAAAWVAGQVAPDAIVACDPAMCAALQARGLTAGRLDVLGTAAGDPLGSDVVVATAAVRSRFGARLEGVYAPLMIASFGTGAGRIDIRAVAPDGAAPYRAALARDLSARISGGRQLAGNRHIRASAGARAALKAGKVDARLLLALSEMAGQQSLRIVAFGDPSPGASAAVPFRMAEITVAGAGSRVRLRSMLSFLDGQRPPYLPARAGIDSQSVLTVEYSAPSPLGLLGGQ